MKAFLLLLISFCLVTTASAQKRAPSRVTPRQIACPERWLVDTKKPGVFLTFVRREQFGPASPRANRLFFRLTNNTCWPIWLDMGGTENPRYGDARLFYQIEEKESGRPISGTLECHSCSVNRISSGKAIVFSIPYEDADREATLRIRYVFESEKDMGDYDSSTSMHTVVYYFNGLPRDLFPKL